MAKIGIIGTVAEGFAESTRNVYAANKENMRAIKADTKANFEAATTPDPGLEKFKEAKGLKNKVKAIGQNIKDGAAEASEAEKERRTEIPNHTAYRAGLEEQRTRWQATINGSY